MKEDVLLSYAYERFESGEYDAALEAFVLVYQRGYEQKWVLDNIYRCYMAGNEEEFKKSYACWDAGERVEYKECTLDFIPYRDGEYYIYDKELAIFRGVFSVRELQEEEPNIAFKNMEFSAAALVIDWDWRDAKSILTTACERKIYIISSDVKRCLSFWKIPELREYLGNIMLFSDYEEFQHYFHENSSVYLPRVFYGNEDQHRQLLRIRNEEHQYRLTPQGRSTENVLLTIAIPTANRGNLLLKQIKNLLTMPYDAEIEIAVTKNGTRFYEEEYEQVSKMQEQDARLKYYDHRKELRCVLNWHYAVEMSSGKYVMVMSDEDHLFIDMLEYYLKLLTTHSDLAMVRPRSTQQYLNIDKIEFGKKGWDAFEIVFLRQSHFPGLIVRRSYFIEADLLKFESYIDNLYYRDYPHEWWCIMLSQKGDCMKVPVILCDDSHPVDHEKEIKMLGLPSVQQWKPYEARIGQFLGIIDFLKTVMKIDDKARYKRLLYLAMNKTVHLFEITKKTGYNSDNYEGMLKRFMEISIGVIDESFLDADQKISLLYSLNNLCLNSIESSCFGEGQEVSDL